jgi:hypothetical protein
MDALGIVLAIAIGIAVLAGIAFFGFVVWFIFKGFRRVFKDQKEFDKRWNDRRYNR